MIYKDLLYSLEKHKNGKPKHICPSCEKRTFVYYINNKTLEYLNDKVGRCDRQDKCGYHYTPREYFKNNPDKIYNSDKYIRTRTLVPCTNSTSGTNELKTDADIPFKYIEQAAKTRNSTLIEYFFNLFDWQTICDATDKYFIGCTKDRAVIYPQIDANGKVRTAKIQQYNPETGKRLKEPTNTIGWVHRKLINKGLLSKDFKLSMCLFGEHLIRSDRYKNMAVGIVESEKSALIASACMPNILWMAAGAMEWLNVAKLAPLKDRKIILYPDTSATNNAFNKWSKIAKEAKCQGFDISVSTMLENKCTDEQKAKGYDLGDYLIDKILNRENTIQVQPEKRSDTLQSMIDIKPIFSLLIDRFDAVEVSTIES